MAKNKTSVSAPADHTGNGEKWAEIERKATEAIARSDLEAAMIIADCYDSMNRTVPNPNMNVDSYHHQLALVEKLKMDRYAQSWIHENMAQKYTVEGDFRHALATYQKILEIFEKDKSPLICEKHCTDHEGPSWYPDNELHMAYIRQQMARIHAMMGQYDTALGLFTQALKVCAYNCEFIRSGCSTSDVYQDMGDLEMGRKNYRKALNYYRMSLGFEPDKIDSESDLEIKKRMKKAEQLEKWVELYSRLGVE